MLSAVGGDFPEEYAQALKRMGVGLEHLQWVPEKNTFYFESEFGYDLNSRKAIQTSENAMSDLHAQLPKEFGENDILYLGTMPPKQQIQLLEQAECKACFMDTIEFFIQGEKNAVIEAMKLCNGVVLNDSEARMLSGTHNLVKALYWLLDLGTDVAVIKKGEHGSICATRESLIALPAFPLSDVVDPTGAGDAFAGGLVGSLAEQGGEMNEQNLKLALSYGTVMGSFTVEDFGLNKLMQLDKGIIEDRLSQYKRMLSV
jgi:sugar/nucleoside kinase (ribokinase family)